MSYVVTARKWRPQRFGDVISQKHVTETLKSAIKNDRVGHAYLFSGPRGVGKTTVARIFAKALNCEHGPAEEPCNECDKCLAIQGGSSMDIQELDGASNNSVEDVRNLISNVGYHASHCLYKMYIIDEVHMLSTAAFNALLKTLEEPPPNVIFIFATTEPHKIPVTILSRCQRFDFRRLSVHDIAGKLKTIAEGDSLTIDDGSVMLIAQRAAGAMRDAESILEQLKSSRGESVTVAEVTEVLGIADREVFFRIIERCHESDVFGIIELFRNFYDDGGDLKEFVEGLLGHLRDLLYSHYENGIAHVMLDESMKARIVEQSGWFNEGDLIRMAGYITEVESSLNYAVLPVLRIEIGLARLASMETTLQLKEVLNKLGGESTVQIMMQGPAGAAAPRPQAAPAAQAQTQTSAPAPAPQQAAPQANSQAVPQNMSQEMPPDYDYQEAPEQYDIDSRPESATARPEPATAQPQEVVASGGSGLTVGADIDSIKAAWNDILEHIANLKPHIRPSLAMSQPLSYEAGRIKVAFQKGQSFQVKTVEANIEPLEEILSSVLGTSVKVTCDNCLPDKNNGTANGSAANGGEKKKNEFGALIEREPIIGDILERFDGEIKDTWRK